MSSPRHPDHEFIHRESGDLLHTEPAVPGASPGPRPGVGDIVWLPGHGGARRFCVHRREFHYDVGRITFLVGDVVKTPVPPCAE